MPARPHHLNPLSIKKPRDNRVNLHLLNVCKIRHQSDTVLLAKVYRRDHGDRYAEVPEPFGSKIVFKGNQA